MTTSGKNITKTTEGITEISTEDFVTVLKKLEDHLPISDQYDLDCGQEKGVWWKSQKQHMLRWFSNQDSLGSGKFTREKPNTSARTAYNRLKCPGALLWIAEAIGIDSEDVQVAADAARDEPNKKRRPGIIRSHIPWGQIRNLANR